MAKKTSDRSDPKKNKSLAIRMVIDRLPEAKYAEVAKVVKEEFGHDVRTNLFYMLKAKSNMKVSRRANKVKSVPTKSVRAPMNSAALWVDAIKAARQLLKATGSVENATALLNAVDVAD